MRIWHFLLKYSFFKVMMVFVEEGLCVNVSNTMCLDMLAFSCNHVIYSKTATKKNRTKGAFWICIELPLLCTLTKDNIGGILSTDHMIHFSKAGRNGTLNVKQKCTGANVVLRDMSFKLCIYLTKKSTRKLEGPVSKR